MGATRTTIATVTLILVVFVATFLVVSYSRLSPPAVGAGRSRHVLRRGVKTASAKLQTSSEYREEFPRIPVRDIDKSDTRRHVRRTRRPTAIRKVEVVTVSTASTTKTITHRSTPIPAWSKYRGAHNVSTRWRSWWPNRKRKSNETRPITRPRFQLPWSRKLNKTRLFSRPAFKWPNWGRKSNKTRLFTRPQFQWSNRNRKSNETGLFKDQLTPSERAKLLTMFGAVTDALTASNVTFWMDGGTLLGSYRHHNLIPWDDDVNLVLCRSKKRQARRAIKSLAPAYQLFVEKDATSSPEPVWRIFARNSSAPVTRRKFRFPTIDLHFFASNSTHIWLEPHNLWWYYGWRKSTVFPLHLRPFDKYWAPAPCNTRTYLVKEFDRQVIDQCSSPRMSHRKNIGKRRSSVPCRSLRQVPIVKRKRDGVGAVTEILVRGEEKIQEHVIHTKC